MNFFCQPLSYDSGFQPLYCTCSLLYYADKLYFFFTSSVKLCLMILVVNLYILLLYLYRCYVNAGSVMNYACVLFLSNFHFQNAFYRVSTKKVHFSPPDRKAKVNFFMDTLHVCFMFQSFNGFLYLFPIIIFSVLYNIPKFFEVEDGFKNNLIKRIQGSEKTILTFSSYFTRFQKKQDLLKFIFKL